MKFPEPDKYDINLAQALRQLETEYFKPAYARPPDVIGSPNSTTRLHKLDLDNWEISHSGHDFKLSAAKAFMLHEPHKLCDPAKKLPLFSSALRLITWQCRA